MGHRPLQRHEGSCHCGAVRFEIDTDFPELTTCDCSICRRRNALMVKVHESNFRLLSGEGALTEYRFHTHTARHFFCSTCGIYPFHRKRVTPELRCRVMPLPLIVTVRFTSSADGPYVESSTVARLIVPVTLKLMVKGEHVVSAFTS